MRKERRLKRTQPNQPHRTILAVMPDLFSRDLSKVIVVGHGPTVDLVRPEAQRNVERRHGPSWPNAWRSVKIGNKADILIKFKQLNVEELDAAISGFYRETVGV